MFIERAIQALAKGTSWVRACLALAIASAPIMASAQLQSLDSTRDGRGTLGYATRVSATTVRRVRVVLRSDHRADITLLSGASERFSGNWRGGGLTKVYMDIDRVGNDPALGTGQIIHDARGEFASLYMSGSVGNRKFEFKFDAEGSVGGGGGGGGSNRELNITSPRNGAIVSSSHVEIEGTSRARDVNVRVYDEDKRLVANRNVDVRNNRWSTRVNLDRGRYRLVARDRNSRKTDEISFSYRRGNDDNDDEWIQKFKDNAKRAVRNRFDGYELVFTNTTVGSEAFGNRTVKGDLEVRGKGSRRGEYRWTAVCGAGTAEVKSVSYARR
jgi:hypothetical protein